MIEKKELTFHPDFAVPPGVTLQETLDHLGMSQAELAKRTGRPKKAINEIIKGKAAITPETALQLERVLAVPAHFWNNLECNYREALARKKEREHLRQYLSWLDHIPVREMTRYRWIPGSSDKVDQLLAVLNFFGATTPKTLDKIWLRRQTAFRKSRAFETNPWAVAAWLRMGESEAQRIDCRPFDRDRFKESLKDIRKCTAKPPEVFIPEMRKLCAESGVAVVFVRELPKTLLSGAVRWLTPEKALIQLSLRYKADDQLWFSFFHEAGHILLHGKRDVFIDDGDRKDRNKKETAADRFAADFLIPSNTWRIILDDKVFDEMRINLFAAQLGIAPGIIVGRLQYDGHMPFNRLNKLKQRFDWGSFEEILSEREREL